MNFRQKLWHGPKGRAEDATLVSGGGHLSALDYRTIEAPGGRGGHTLVAIEECWLFPGAAE